LPPTDWSRSLVTIEVTFKVHDAFQPWNDPTSSIRKHGLVVASGEILTTAQYLPAHTLVRLQKGGRGRWFDARVKWWDAQSNLALLTTEAPDFWTGLTPARLEDKPSRNAGLELVRWRQGNLENARVDFSRFTVGEGVLGFAPHVTLEVNTDLGGLGWSEIVVRAGRVVGMTTHASSRTCGLLPATFISRVLNAQRANTFGGLGYFDFTWQPGRNPALLAELGQDGSPRGVVVQKAGRESDPAKSPQARDILLEIDGFAIDGEGDYLDPDFGHLQLENLPNRAHFAGQTIPIKIRRGVAELTLDYTIPRADFADELVPREVFGAPPKYVVAGGLVFQPLAQPFLRGWGEEWRKYAPFRLQYLQYADAPDGRDSLVVLSGVLPDAINLGYQDAGLLAVDEVNGRKIATLADLVEALRTPSEGGVHRVEFLGGRNLQRLLLDAATLDEATKRVVEHYGIPAASRL
jgi:S1-C subfamily serine protease